MGCCKLEVYLGGVRVGEGEGEGEGSDAMFFLFPPPAPRPRLWVTQLCDHTNIRRISPVSIQDDIDTKDA